MMLPDHNSLNPKYLKLVNHTASKRTDWSYKAYCKIGIPFNLHWAMNEGEKEKMTPEEIKKKLLRKENDASKAEQGDRILLCQNNHEYGHRVTHVVETVTATADEQDEIWIRPVKVVWVA